jgi:hypothetical protein
LKRSPIFGEEIIQRWEERIGRVINVRMGLVMNSSRLRSRSWWMNGKIDALLAVVPAVTEAVLPVASSLGIVERGTYH